jgi:hypothetical protein
LSGFEILTYGALETHVILSMHVFKVCVSVWKKSALNIPVQNQRTWKTLQFLNL